eukprot:COSAG01_NODE_2361_length_7832_cov_12.919447_6_plen_349_part_00
MSARTSAVQRELSQTARVHTRRSGSTKAGITSPHHTPPRPVSACAGSISPHHTGVGGGCGRTSRAECAALLVHLPDHLPVQLARQRPHLADRRPHGHRGLGAPPGAAVPHPLQSSLLLPLLACLRCALLLCRRLVQLLDPRRLLRARSVRCCLSSGGRGESTTISCHRQGRACGLSVCLTPCNRAATATCRGANPACHPSSRRQAVTTSPPHHSPHRIIPSAGKEGRRTVLDRAGRLGDLRDVPRGGGGSSSGACQAPTLAPLSRPAANWWAATVGGEGADSSRRLEGDASRARRVRRAGDSAWNCSSALPFAWMAVGALDEVRTLESRPPTAAPAHRHRHIVSVTPT